MANLEMPAVGVSAFTVNKGETSTPAAPKYAGTITFAPADTAEDAALLGFWESLQVGSAEDQNTVDMQLFDGLFSSGLGDYDVTAIGSSSLPDGSAIVTLRVSQPAGVTDPIPVSYTHLTLPTICSV